MRIDAEQLCRKGLLGNAVVIVQPSLGAPADVERGMHMIRGPLHNVTEFRPVIDFFKGQMLHRRTRDDASVKIAVPDFIKRFIEGMQVLGRRIDAGVCFRSHQFQVNLQGSVAQKTRELNFCLDFFGHQVDQEDLERTDILGDSASLGHDEDVFLMQNINGWQPVGYFNRHGILSSAYLI